MKHRHAFAALFFVAVLALLAPPTFAGGCGELCTFEDCEPGGEPEEGCIERRFGCLDMLCYFASTASCPTGSVELSERIDAALEGVDIRDRAAVAEALDALGTPLRYVVKGEVIYESRGYELAKLNLPRAQVGQVAEAAPAADEAAPVEN